MKKFILIFLLIFAFNYAFSQTLKRYYYKDYGYITRIVFVFDKKPDFKFKKQKSSIVIYISNGKISQNIHNKTLYKNNVLHKIVFEKDKDDLNVILSLNNEYFSKYFTLRDNGYKIVADIFYSPKAKTIDEHKSYAYFYKSIGLKKRADWHLNQIEKLKVLPVIKDTLKDTILTKSSVKKDTVKLIVPIKKDSVKNNEKKSVPQKKYIAQKKLSIFQINIRIVAVGLLIVFIVIFIIVFKKRKKTSELMEKAGIGDENFNENLAIMLFEKGWKVPEIARELNMTEKDVKKIKKKNRDIIKRVKL